MIGYMTVSDRVLTHPATMPRQKSPRPEVELNTATRP